MTEMSVAVFTDNLNFLDWTKKFDSNVIRPPTGAGWRYIVSRKNLGRKIAKITKQHDIAFVDFLTPFGKKVIQYSTTPVYIRIHRFELDTPELFQDVIWDNVAAVIGVSKHYGDLLRKLVPSSIPISVIPPGVAAAKWPFHPSSTGKLCTWSIPTPRKRIYDLLLALREQKLYLGGYSAEERILVDRKQRFNLPHVFEPDIVFPDWLWDKEIYIHHALDESFGVSIAEAMLSGLIPLVHRIPCILEFVPKELTYVYDFELLELIDKYRSLTTEEALTLKKNLREIIIRDFTSDTTADKMLKLFSKEV